MKNKTESKEKILSVAAFLFQTKGYNATGLNEILRESGSPKGSLYYYFPGGKEELALEAIHLASKSIQAKLKIALDKYSNPIKAIQFIINNIMQDLKKDKTLNNISIGLIALETHLSCEPLREACMEAFTALQDIYAERLIQSGIDIKTAHELGTFIQVIIEGALTVSFTQKNDIVLLTVSNQINNLLSPYLIER